VASTGRPCPLYDPELDLAVETDAGQIAWLAGLNSFEPITRQRSPSSQRCRKRVPS
jgi:hypothetical protein